MKKLILAAAQAEARELVQKYDGIKTIIFDDWRGWRFIIDSADLKRCDNNCSACPLYQFLTGSRIKFKYAKLIPASERDKKVFGPRQFLNCKSWREYQQCYINFFATEIKSPTEFRAELRLLRNMRVLYFKLGSVQKLESRFKSVVIKKSAFLVRD